MSDTTDLADRLESLPSRERQMEREYPVGTVNADDAWDEFLKEKKEIVGAVVPTLRRLAADVKGLTAERDAAEARVRAWAAEQVRSLYGPGKSLFPYEAVAEVANRIAAGPQTNEVSK